MDAPRSPMDNLFTIISGFSAGHEKALKQGIYNAVALFLLGLVIAAGYALHLILQPFTKPLVWALLCGSVLFPFKLSLCTAVQSWFDSLESSGKPLIVNVSMVPILIVDKIAETIGSFLYNRIKYIILVIVLGTVTLAAYQYTPNILACLIWRMIQVISGVIHFFVTSCNIYTIALIVIGYLSVLYVYWTPKNSREFRFSSFVIWFMVSVYFSNILGAYEVPLFCALQFLYVVGFIYQVILIVEHNEISGKKMAFTDAVKLALFNEVESSERSEDLNEDTIRGLREYKQAPKLSKKSISLDADFIGTKDLSQSQRSKSSSSVDPKGVASLRDRYFLRKLKAEFKMSVDYEDDQVDTAKYMYGALYACIGMLLWKHKWIIQILTIPTLYYMAKQVGSYFGFWRIIQNQLDRLVGSIGEWCYRRNQALLPANIRGLYKLGIIFERKMTSALKSSVDTVATTAVIVTLLLFTICASIFITIQIYSEGIHLVQITGEILNSSLINNADIDWVPEQWEESVNSVLDNAYTYGRGAISDAVKGLVKDLEPAKAEHMEKKVLELWDRLYQAWMMSNDDPELIGPGVDTNAAFSAWENFRDGFGKAPLQLFNMTGIQNFAKENIGILTSVLDSVWSIVKGNVSVILSILTELLYLVLMSSSAVLNFTLNLVVFFTTLFYLLSSSGSTYKPIELITKFSPIGCHRFAEALQEAVIGVFAATFKLASFFGMWTWFIHNLFQVKVVYLPSVFAMILGAMPVLDAYFACIPASLELWFTRGPMTAVFFFLFHFLPCNIVVTDFYKEIKGGGHPYITGLSIAGGIFCLGVQGAIFGPLLLCCIMVAINLSRRYLLSPSEETIKTIKSRIDQLETDSGY